MANINAGTPRYYVPHTAFWPIVGSVALTSLLVGFAMVLNESRSGFATPLVLTGTVLLVVMLFGWFGDVIRESQRGMYSSQVDMSFRMGMVWFIFSEIMFFAAFFGALFYARTLALPWLGGEGSGAATNAVLYPGFEAAWPSNGPLDVGGVFQIMSPWGLPLINTLLLLTSGLTITNAHWALKLGQRTALIWWMVATIALGLIFLVVQVYEYMHAYNDLNLKLSTGIYGATFFMLTGFHGLHVTLGLIMLIVILFRCMAGHFTADRHFAFEAVAWYWHFVDVVWLGLFVFVYVL